jgi:hypothetical protein
LNPEAVSNQLSDFFSLPFSPELFSKPSRVTTSPIHAGKGQLVKWKKILSKTEISEIKEIVHDVFGFYEINFD